MVAILFFIIFLMSGLWIAFEVFSDQNMPTRLWLGLILGVILMTWSPIFFAFAFGFSLTSHILGIILSIGISILIYNLKRKGIIKNYGVPLKPIIKQSISLSSKKKSRPPQIIHDTKSAAEADTEAIMPKNAFKAMLWVCVPLVLLICILTSTHVFMPGKDGLYSGQSTYGDLQMHGGIVTNIAENEKFPPEYSIFKGEKLGYPFLVDSLSSSFYKFGMNLRWSMLVPSFLIIILLVFGFFLLAFELFKSAGKAVIASLLFFINGGFGFFYFLNNAKAKPVSFTQIFTEFYKTPTNLTNESIRWVNTICDMIIPQRTTMFGWTVVIVAFWLLYRAIKKQELRYFITAGFIAGLLPMIHTHSFMAFGIISAVWFAAFFHTASNKSKYFSNWMIFGIITAIFAVPQLAIWTVSQATQGHFIKFHLDWCNTQDPWLWFWIKNIGVVFLLIIPAWLDSNKEKRLLYLGPLALFIVAELFLFQPLDYDNNKLFYIWYIFSVIMVADYLWNAWVNNKTHSSRWALAVLLVIACTFSGVLTIGREAVSSTYQIHSANDIRASEFIKAHTPKDALFLTSDNHTNFVSTLTGRYIFCGFGGFLGTHGIDMQKRQNEVNLMYTKPQENAALFNNDSIDYVLISNAERSKFKPDEAFFNKYFKTVYKANDISIYAVSDRAKK